MIRTGVKNKRKYWKYAAFDIETWGLDANRFAFGTCMWNKQDGTTGKKVFYKPTEMVGFMTSRKFKGYRWFAHNGGGYDLIGLFGNYLEDKNFKIIFNGGRLISAVYKKSGYKITFSDSLNFFSVKLDRLGQDIGFPKGYTPDKFKITEEDQENIRKIYYMGFSIKEIATHYNIKETSVIGMLNGTFAYHITQEDIDYCMQDTNIVLTAINKFSDFIYNRYGVNITNTIASTTQKVFFSNYLNKNIKVNKLDLFFRKSYYGGRTEVIEGKDHNIYPVFYYDFNSLYPSVMIDGIYPDPEDLQYTIYPDINIINKEGASLIDVEVYSTHYPPLPYRKNGKLIFPVGRWVGWYNHNEIRNALEYKTIKIYNIYKSVYSNKTWSPFRNYIDDLYNLRLKFKAQKNQTGNLYTKLLMNSLYGKFAQHTEKKEFGFIDMPPKRGNNWEFEAYKDSDAGMWKALDKWGKVIKEEGKNNIISLASYTTSYARIKLYNLVQKVLQQGGKVYYTDTDSIMTNVQLPSSKKLGDVKLEGIGALKPIAPKVYQWVNLSLIQNTNEPIHLKAEDKTYYVKVKGISGAKHLQKVYQQRRVIKVKEALRRGLKAGESMSFVKELKNEDEKRIWKDFRSLPLDIQKEEEIERRTNEIIRSIISGRCNYKPVIDFYKQFGKYPKKGIIKNMIKREIYKLDKKNEKYYNISRN